MHRSTIIVREANKLPPDEFLAKAIEANKSCYGFALASSGKIVFAKEKEGITLDEMKQFFNDFASARVISTLGGADGEMVEDDLQPFTLLEESIEKKKSPVLVAFAEGDFVSYEHPESNRSKPFFLVNEGLLEEVKELYDKHKQDIVATMKDMDSVGFRRRVRNMILPGRGAILLLAKTGDIMIYSNNVPVEKLEWGWSSNLHGYVAPVAAQTTVERPKGKLSVKERMAALEKEAAEEEEMERLTAPDPKIATAVKTTPTSTTPIIPAKTGTMIPVPTGYSVSKRRKWFQRNMIGGRPENWMQARGIPFDQLKEGSPYLKSSTKSFSDLQKIVDAQTEEPDDEDKTDRDIIETAPATGGGVITDLPPVIPAAKKEEAEEFLKKLMEADKLVNLDKLQEMENKYGSFFSQTGYPLHLFLRWPFKKRREFTKNYSFAAAVALGNLCAMLLDAKPELLKEPSKAKAEPKKALSISERMAAQGM